MVELFGLPQSLSVKSSVNNQSLREPGLGLPTALNRRGCGAARTALICSNIIVVAYFRGIK